jgi:uncharacterized membrane protein YccC
VVLFALMRALAVALAVAIAFGLDVPNADWIPIATFVAVKGSLQQTTLVAEQRVAGALPGGALAALMLVTVHDKHALEAVLILLAVVAASIRTVNYALYFAASRRWYSSPWTCRTRRTSPTRDEGCSSRSSAWASASS